MKLSSNIPILKYYIPRLDEFLECSVAIVHIFHRILIPNHFVLCSTKQ